MLSSCLKYTSFFVLSMLLSSCITNRNTRYLQDIKGAYPPYDSTAYKISKNDEISILIYTVNADANKLFSKGSAYKIFSDGTIDIPFVDTLKITGLSIEEARLKIESKLKDYIPDAEVKIALSNKSFYVFGEGGGNGQFPLYKDKLNIFEALAMSGDLNVTANRKKIKIIRECDNEKKIIEFDIRSKDLLDSDYYYIRPNDIIYLSRSKKGFYNITSFSSVLGMISSSLTFVLLVVNYSN